MKTRPFVSHWMPVVVWMLIIFGASTDLGSARHTSRFLIPLLRWINPQISIAALAACEIAVRKGAHISEYAILAVLLIRALRAKTERAFLYHAALVLVAAALYAATDEFHQSFTPSRTAAARDVMIDCCGAALGLAAFWLISQRRRTDRCEIAAS